MAAFTEENLKHTSKKDVQKIIVLQTKCIFTYWKLPHQYLFDPKSTQDNSGKSQGLWDILVWTAFVCY